MTDLPTLEDAERSEFITALEVDVAQYSDHKEYDAEIREYLTQAEYAKLRSPQTRDDYHELVMLVVSRYPFLRGRKTMKYYSDLVKKEYTGDDVAEHVWDDFKRMTDICLVHGRFRAIRVLGKFYTDVFFWKNLVTKLWWRQVSRYNLPANDDVDW